MSSSSEPKYIDALDVYSFLRSKEDISSFLTYLFEQAIEFSKLIEEYGNTKPYPIQFNSSQHVYQIDYQFTIYVLGKWIAKRTNDSSKLEKVLRGYAITSHSLANTQCKKNMKLLALFFEDNIGIFRNHGENETPKVKDFRQFNRKIVEHNEKYYEYKMLSVNRHQMKYFIGDEWKDYMLDNDEYFYQNGVEQVAFGNSHCIAFWNRQRAETGSKDKLYFKIIDTDYLEGVDAIWKRNAKA